jgi:hypothetical protein
MPVVRIPVASSSFVGKSAKRPARPRKILIGFRAYSRGRLTLPIVQINPVCRTAGSLTVNARRGVNLIRFNGRLAKKWLHDGTYVLVTPSQRIRFAVVSGRPTRKKTRLQPSVCREGAVELLAGEPPALGSAAAGLASDGSAVAVSGNATNGGITEGSPGTAGRVLPTGVPGPSKVLGTAVDEVREAVTGLHPAFYVLLGIAMAVLAAATIPASAVPSPWLGATLARRRAALTLAGTGTLVAVMIAYLFTVGA